MDSIPSIDPSGVIRDVIAFFESKKENRLQIRRFLRASIEENCLLGRDWVPSDNLLLNTEAAFIPLRLVGDSARSEDLVSVIKNHDRLVLQGQPGAGKSTITRYVALIMARATLDRRRYRQWPLQLLGLPPLFPLRIELSACSSGQTVEQAIHSSIPGVSARSVEQRIQRVPVLFLFDGLDEITNSRRRNEVAEEIRQLTFRYSGYEKGHRFLVTTRSSSYRHQTLAGGRYALYRVDELAVDQQDTMIRQYYQIWSTKSQVAAESGRWHERANDLADQLRKNAGLARLRSNPLLLSQICYLHFTGEALPAKRHEVYRLVIEHLISRRDDPIDIAIAQRMAVLDEIAIEMFQQKDIETISRERIEEIIAAPQSGRSPSHGTTVDEIEKEWGILVQRSVGTESACRYAFANMSFQEYLAAHAIHRNPSKYWPLLQEHLLDDRWEEVMLLYSAMPAIDKHHDPLEAVVGTLMATDHNDSLQTVLKVGKCLANDRTPPIRWHQEVFQRLQESCYGEGDDNVRVLEVLCQIEPEGPELILDRVVGRSGYLDQDSIIRMLRRIGDSAARQHLREIFLRGLDERPTLEQRIRIAEALGQIGDPRLGAFLDVTHTKGRRSQVAFRIGKYPVTNEEYSHFLQSTSRPKPSHWQLDGYPVLKTNHPVTFVSLSDAMAYCEWISQKTGKVCRLPSADEWLLVALPDGPNHLFPWGSHMKTFNLNFRMQVKDTTPVGIYPEGASETHVADLLGNVWEWTCSQNGNQYVLKGGSWSTMHELQEEGAFLERLESPESRLDDAGFRIVIE